MTKYFLLLALLIFISCNEVKLKNTKGQTDTSNTLSEVNPDSNSTSNSKTNNIIFHLKDTLEINTNSIVILRPDSIRFFSYITEEDNRIYEVDSDFGFATYKAIEQMKSNKIYKNIKIYNTDKRFISYSDSTGIQQIIDRDTVDYGLIMLKKGEDIKIDNNIFPYDYYIYIINKYFELKN